MRHSAPKGTFQFEAKLTGLRPDTVYHYAVYDGSKRLTPNDGTYTFRTHPAAGTKRELYFWAVGDSGTGSVYQKAVFEAMREFILYINAHSPIAPSTNLRKPSAIFRPRFPASPGTSATDSSYVGRNSRRVKRPKRDTPLTTLLSWRLQRTGVPEFKLIDSML